MTGKSPERILNQGKCIELLINNITGRDISQWN